MYPLVYIESYFGKEKEMEPSKNEFSQVTMEKIEMGLRKAISISILLASDLQTQQNELCAHAVIVIHDILEEVLTQFISVEDRHINKED